MIDLRQCKRCEHWCQIFCGYMDTDCGRPSRIKIGATKVCHVYNQKGNLRNTTTLDDTLAAGEAPSIKKRVRTREKPLKQYVVKDMRSGTLLATGTAIECSQVTGLSKQVIYNMCNGNRPSPFYLVQEVQSG